jgi:hypothetical protein
MRSNTTTIAVKPIMHNTVPTMRAKSVAVIGPPWVW